MSENGFVRIPKDVLLYLGMLEGDSITIRVGEEILLSTSTGGVKLSIQGNNRIQLPSYVLNKLGIDSKTVVCFIERMNAVALKKFEVNIKESEFPRIVDLEYPQLLIRQVETFAEPQVLFERLKETAAQQFKLKYNPENYWLNIKTFNAWKARKILEIIDKNDTDLQQELIQDRLLNQEPNGSWENSVVLTARNLLELNELGMSNNYPQMQSAISWLINQPESPHNPGMFFLNGDLVSEQKQIVLERKEQTDGPRSRFRKRLKTEINQITQADPLYYNACGQRIMWPNALVLEALLALGYEYHERIFTALQTLTFSNWCECRYQHGISSWKRKKPFELKDIQKFEHQVMFEYYHGGIRNLKLLSANLSKTHLIRLKETKLDDCIEYELKQQFPQQGCEYITVGALHQAKDEKLWRITEAHLWRFVVLFFNLLQQPEFLDEVERYNLTPYFQLQVFAKYDILPAKIGIMLALPWIMDNQNSDGSWGISEYKDNATLAIISALKRIDYL